MGFGIIHSSKVCVCRRGDGTFKVCVLDFEWSGRNLHSKCPGFMNSEIQWPSGVGPGEPLLQRHDTQLMKQSFQDARKKRSKPRVSHACMGALARNHICQTRLVRAQPLTGMVHNAVHRSLVYI